MMHLLLAVSLMMQAPQPVQVPQDSAPSESAQPQSGQPQSALERAGVAPGGAAPTLVVQTREDSILEEKTKAVASNLRCPVCQGLSIQDSPSELARQMRALVKDKLAHGESAEQVTEYFTSKYGDWILLQPPASGFNLAVYLLPLVMLLGGAVLIIVLARKWTHHPAPVVEAAEDVEVEDESRV
jgi:cytochrome c-type biogenesis protein CcmH/NrfF